MDIALIVLGVGAFAIAASWLYARLSDPKDINEEEEREVRSESAAEHERATFEERQEAVERAIDEMHSNDSE